MTKKTADHRDSGSGRSSNEDDLGDRGANQNLEGFDLRDSLGEDVQLRGFGTMLNELFAPVRGIEFEIPPRTDMVPDKSIFDE